MKVLIFDTETTGLWSNTLISLDKQPEVFDWFGLTFDTETHEVLGELQRYSKPYGKIEVKASKATGKKDEDFAGYDRFEVSANDIKQYIEKHDAVLGHNVVFDIEVTNFEFKRLGMEVNWPPAIDTVEKTEWIKGHRLSLTDLHLFLFDAKFEGAHEAKTDVLATMRCYSELLKRGWI